MKIPSFDNSKSLILLGVAGLAAYAVYRVVSTGQGIGQGVADAARNAWQALVLAKDDAAIYAEKLRTRKDLIASGGALPPVDPADQSEAETKRLIGYEATSYNGVPVGFESPDAPGLTPAERMGFPL